MNVKLNPVMTCADLLNFLILADQFGLNIKSASPKGASCLSKIISYFDSTRSNNKVKKNEINNFMTNLIFFNNYNKLFQTLKLECKKIVK